MNVTPPPGRSLRRAVPAPAARRGALLGGAVLTLGLVVTLAIPSTGASAAPSEPVYPSQSDVDRARAAVGTAQGQVAALDAQFAAASARVEAAANDAAAAAEEYQGARLKLEQASSTASRAKASATTAQAGADKATLQVRRYAAAVYQQNGSLGDLDAFMSANGPQDLMDRIADMDTVGQARNRTLTEASTSSQLAASKQAAASKAKAQLVAAETQAEQAKQAADAKAAQANAVASSVQREQQATVEQLARLQKTSVRLEQERQAGIAAAAAELARRQAAVRAQQAAAAAARKAAEAAEAARDAMADRDNRPDPKPTTPKPPTTTPPPPTSGGVSAVLAYARAQLGKPYLWGGEGPNSFDCSGLTMMAWRQAGVRMSHYTGYQYAETARVPIAQLKPGDLVFYGKTGPTSHHVGLYVGNGQMIEAPNSRAVVRYASIYRSDLLPYGGRPG